MADLRGNVSPRRRLAYSLAGLAAGNVALLIYLSISAARARSALLAQHLGQPARQFPLALEMFAVYCVFSLVGWALVGAPVAAFVPSRTVARLPWPAVVLLGGALGPLALFLMFLLLSRGAVLGAPGAFRDLGALWLFAAIVSAVAFVVYAALLRRYAQQ